MSDAYPLSLPPTQDELPCDDDDVMETARHRLQMELLIETLQPHIRRRPGGGYVGGNMFVYFSLAQVRHQDYKGPDFFVALDVSPKERKSWVVWEEGKGPDVVIELLSPSTAETDKRHKKHIYESRLRVPEYYWYDPFNADDFAGFQLQGEHYTPLQADSHGNVYSHTLGLHLSRWTGRYRDTETVWLRWMDAEGVVLPTGEELAIAARQDADAARQDANIAREETVLAKQLADTEKSQAERLAEKLRALGIDPDTE